MKKLINAFLALAAGLAIAGCAKEYDDSALQSKVNDLDKKVTELEKKVNALTEQVTGLATTIDEWKKGGFVESVTDIKEGDAVIGYTVTFVGGKTVVLYNGKDGAPGKDGDPGAPGKDGENGATGADGQTPTIILYEGNLVWAIGDKPILVDNKPVPANVVPTFAINDEGHLIMTLLGQETDLGKVKGEDGAAGTGGDSILKSIEKSADGKNLVFTLNGDPEVVYEIPFATAFKLVIEKTEQEVKAGETVKIPFTIENGEGAVVDCFPGGFYSAKIEDNNVVVTVPDPFFPGHVLVWAQNDKGLYSMVKLSFITTADVVVVTPADEIEAIPAAAGEFVINLTSNVDLDAKVPEDATWISKAEVTKADYKLTLTLTENETGAPREAEISIVRKDNGQEVKTVKIVQLYEAPAPLDPAQAGDVLWAEDWSAVPTDKEKSEVEDYDYSSTVVYGGRKVAYAITHSASTTSKSQLYYDTQYGYKDNGTAVKDGNLLIAKGNGTFTVSGIPVAEAKAATLTFKVNAKRDVIVTSPTENVTVGERAWGEETSKPYSATVKITFGENVEKFALLFTNADASNNVRVDDLQVVVDGEVAPKELTIKNVFTKNSTDAEAWNTYYGGTAGTDRNIAMDDEYVYIAESSATAKLWAISIADPNQAKQVNVEGVSGGAHALSCPRVIKNTDANVNGGKDVLICANLTRGGEDPKLYMWVNGIDSAPKAITLTTWATDSWYGDTFTVWGTLQDGVLLFDKTNSGGNGVVTFILNGVPEGDKMYLVGRIKTVEAFESHTGVCAFYPFPDGTAGVYSPGRGTEARGQVGTLGNSLKTEGGIAVTFSPLDYDEGTNGFVLGYNFVEWEGHRYVIYGNYVNNKSGYVRVRQGELTDAWSKVASTGTRLYRRDLVSGGLTSGNSAMDITARVINGELYIAAQMQNVGFGLYKLCYE